MPKKKEDTEVTAAVETTESTAEVTDIEPVPVEPAAEVPAEPIKPAVEEPPKPKRTRKKKRMPWTRKLYPSLNRLPLKEAAAKKKEAAAADRQNKPKTDPILTLEVGGEVTTETHEMDAAWHEIPDFQPFASYPDRNARRRRGRNGSRENTRRCRLQGAFV